MEGRHKILFVDDDPALLETYRTLLGQLPSQPEIHTASNGSRAMVMLETDTYRLLICDLRMPKMDGLQVLSIVRRKYPQLRTVALTGVVDEQFRSRAYALGVDLFWHKPASEQEIQMFLECIESLIERDDDSGFRGVQSKSLMDIIQLECISQSSSVLRITNGPLTGRIWIEDGEVIDAEAADLRAEAAFQRILSWRNGTFESLLPEPSRPRTIFKSYSALLLESAQLLDEQRETEPVNGSANGAHALLAKAAKIEGMEFVLAIKGGLEGETHARGLENPQRMSTWAKQSLDRFRTLGDRLNAGALQQVACMGPQRHVALAQQGETDLCVGWRPSLTTTQLQDTMKKVLAIWA